MKNVFEPKSDLEKFGMVVYNALVENFSRTYFVGGTVRDFLLHKKLTDIDIATSATPDEVCNLLQSHFIEYNTGYKNLGIIIASKGQNTATVATFRKELPSSTRYPKIKFTKDAKLDSQRRDFTVNALYLSPKLGKIVDFYNGQKDLKKGKIKFIGSPTERIKQDPLRIVRALRFCLVLGFKLEKKTKLAIKKNFSLTKQLTKNRVEKEINKFKKASNKKIIKDALDTHKILDKYF